MVYRNTYFSDYLVYLFEQFHTCNSNLSLASDFLLRFMSDSLTKESKIAFRPG